MSFFICVIVEVPILVETEYILALWLKNVPDYAVPFSKIAIIESLASIFINPLWIAANATGNIKRNQIYGRLFTLATLPLSCISLMIVPNPIIAVAICAFMQYMYLFYCIYDIKKQLNLDVLVYLKQVIFPSVIIFASLLLLGISINAVWTYGSFIHLLVTSLVLIVVGLMIEYLLMSRGERLLIKNFVSKIIRK